MSLEGPDSPTRNEEETTRTSKKAHQSELKTALTIKMGL